MLNLKALELCRTAIRNDLGTLSDIPHELANTIANIYYKYFFNAIILKNEARENPGWLPPNIRNHDDISEGIKSFVDNTAKIISQFRHAKGFIDDLRNIDKTAKPDLYSLMVDYIIDCLKYDIREPERKTIEQLEYERNMKKDNIDEISNLIDILNI